MNGFRAGLALSCGLLAVAANAAVVAQHVDSDMTPTGKGWGVHQAEGQAPHALQKRGGTGISYHGGPVMLGTNHIYYIFYGNWSGNSAPGILEDLANTMGGTPYWNINTTYTQGSSHISNSLSLGGATFDSYSQGANINDSGVQAAALRAINNGSLPSDSHGVYLVVTSADVNETSGFCTQYCGWHTHASNNGVDIKYGFIGNPDRCPNNCEGIPGNAPNGNSGADGMATVIAHETMESVTDPDLNAWFDGRGAENGDKCNFNFGPTFTTSNGSTASETFGSRSFLVQQNWKNSGSGGCVQHFP
ncbi:MAG: EXORDIUM family protein [Acidobacteriota bacterium]|nr:EXORDIUM family protein [Acidobacteriota bacterium]